MFIAYGLAGLLFSSCSHAFSASAMIACPPPCAQLCHHPLWHRHCDGRLCLCRCHPQQHHLTPKHPHLRHRRILRPCHRRLSSQATTQRHWARQSAVKGGGDDALEDAVGQRLMVGGAAQAHHWHPEVLRHRPAQILRRCYALLSHIFYLSFLHLDLLPRSLASRATYR